MIIAETRRLLLRHFTRDDAAFLMRLVNDPAYLTMIGDRGIRTLEDAEDYCLSILQLSYFENGYGLYALERKADRMNLVDDAMSGELLGMCGLLNREELDGVELGFALLPNWWGQGLAHEAALAVMGHARRDVGLERLVAIASHHNAPSRALLIRLGFGRVGEHHLEGASESLDLFACDLCR